MKLEDEHSYQSFVDTWDRERESMTLQEIDELVRELAQSYYSALSRYSELVQQIRLALRDQPPES